MSQNSEIIPYAVTQDIWMVPCLINRSLNKFQPLSAPFSDQIILQKLQSRQPWMPAEDKALKKITQKLGTKNWSTISRELNKQVHKSLPVRQGKQCRERYNNHLNPCLTKSSWTNDQDLFLLQCQKAKGNKWSQIAKQMPGRNQNQVKNRFNSLIKRVKAEDPVEFLIGQMKGSKIEIPKVETPGFSPLNLGSVLPAQMLTRKYSEVEFSIMADSLRSAFNGRGMSPLGDSSYTPSSLLSFHRN